MTRTPAARLVGLDVARCLALLGMVATHVLDERTPDGTLALGQALAGGRSAALFAVLAGVTLALMTGRTEPVRGRARLGRSAGVAARAVLVGGLGLALGGLDTGIAVILTYYGLLFLLGLPFVGLRAPALAGLAVLWTVAAPVLSHVLRPELPPRTYDNPTFGRLAEPGQLVGELLLTGYYPVVPWLAYLLAGMALGRLDLGRRRVQVAVAAVGAAAVVVATAVSRAATSRPDVVEALLAGGGPPASSGPELLDAIAGGMSGTTPTGAAWEWLLVVAPHTATPFDLAQTIGSALLVIGAALLVMGGAGERTVRAAAVFFGAGTMTLTLYTLHLVMKTPGVPPTETPDSYVVHVLVLLGIGALFVATGRRGPLEWLVSWVSVRVGGPVERAGSRARA
ncbi:MAG: heparan-alpha-glucosaminide N-acetyltransferase domain-containing protein [Nocardioides sp.]